MLEIGMQNEVLERGGVWEAVQGVLRLDLSKEERAGRQIWKSYNVMSEAMLSPSRNFIMRTP